MSTRYLVDTNILLRFLWRASAPGGGGPETVSPRCERRSHT